MGGTSSKIDSKMIQQRFVLQTIGVGVFCGFCDVFLSQLVDQSDDDATETPPSETNGVADTDTDDNDDVDYCELCRKPAGLHKSCRSK